MLRTYETIIVFYVTSSSIPKEQRNLRTKDTLGTIIKLAGMSFMEMLSSRRVLAIFGTYKAVSFIERSNMIHYPFLGV